MKQTDLLRSIDVFAQLSEDDLNGIAALMKEKQVSRDTVVVRHGQPANALYFITSGLVQCSARDDAGMEKRLGSLSDGQSFGEAALLAGEPMPATMQALTDVSFLVLDKADFDNFLAANIHVMLHLTKMVVQRQSSRRSSPPRVETPRPVVPAPRAPQAGGASPRAPQGSQPCCPARGGPETCRYRRCPQPAANLPERRANRRAARSRTRLTSACSTPTRLLATETRRTGLHGLQPQGRIWQDDARSQPGG